LVLLYHFWVRSLKAILHFAVGNKYDGKHKGKVFENEGELGQLDLLLFIGVFLAEIYDLLLVVRHLIV